VKEKHIILGVTGSIAVYKSAELASKMIQNGADVTVIMTRSARKFITPLTFQAITHNKVLYDMFGSEYVPEQTHIGVAEKANLALVIPATANIIGKIAHGIADDFLTTVIMAVKCPVLIAPSMNERMYLNKAVQRNIAILKRYGYKFIDPEEGYLACGGKGIGRLASVEKILSAIKIEFKIR
jgi:phosphopantothenoylcysteine decarboxylase/phosphopantothenate--cysteine ligase